MIDTLGAETSLAGLFALSFLAATLLPGGSEIALFALVRNAPDLLWPALLVATLGNTLGGLTSYACGRFLTRWQSADKLKHAASVRRYGAPALLLSWAPLIGDLLCVAAGWLKVGVLASTLFIAAGKLARYALVIQAATL